MNEKPDAIIITISLGMLKENGYRHWLKNFLNAMERNAKGENFYYWMRQGRCPRHQDISYVYLCIGNKIRYRAIYAGSEGEREMTFEGGKKIFGNAWVILAGPVERAPNNFPMKGFRGFRYSHKIF